MDKQIKKHLERRGVRLMKGRPAQGLLGTDGSATAFLHWFHEGVMGFDSLEYRRQFWREACRHGHTIGDMPRTAIEFADPCRHPYNTWLVNLAILAAAMGASAIVWLLVRTVDAHVRRLRRPTYYEVERARRAELAAERRRIRRRRTTNACPTPGNLRAAFKVALKSPHDMLRFGSMLEDLECYVDNSVIWDAAHGRIVGRHGGIRQWLHDNAPDLHERYKTVMKYKALAKKFRQAVGVSDPIPAADILPADPKEEMATTITGETREKGEESKREYCAELISGRRQKNQRRQPKRWPGTAGPETTGPGTAGPETAGPETTGPETAGPRTAGPGPNDSENTVGCGRRIEVARAIARELLAACEGNVESLAARLALYVSEDFVPKNRLDSATPQRINVHAQYGKINLRHGNVQTRYGKSNLRHDNAISRFDAVTSPRRGPPRLAAG